MRRHPDFPRESHGDGVPLGGGSIRRELLQGIGRSRGDHSDKVHATVVDLRYALRIDVISAQTHYGKAFGALQDRNTSPSAIVADKDCESATIRKAIANEGTVAVILSKSGAKVPMPHDPILYAMRNWVERFFAG